MADQATLQTAFEKQFGEELSYTFIESDCLTVELPREHLLTVCQILRDEMPFSCEQLIDVCGVDYQEYGVKEWRTQETTVSGFSRGMEIHEGDCVVMWEKPRFAVVYHLLSLENNHRIRLRVLVEENQLIVPSVTSIWNGADWFEREAYDLYGIVFENHPDLRRILTDYGFVGHPFRKDFPLVGRVEMRYDAAKQRCVYEPVTVQPRVTVPKVIREDSRYFHPETMPETKPSERKG